MTMRHSAVPALLALLLIVVNPVAARVLPGIDVLKALEFSPLAGKRVGLLTNPAGVDHRGESTLDILHYEDRVDLVALFGPEHGIYGNEKANVPVLDRIDEATGLPVFSLYGRYRKPVPAMLEGIDVLVVDLQDVGSRSYTYISCLRLAMEACFEAGVGVVILDRPNPLGGLKIDGPVLEERWESYVGTFPIPYVHGMTIGELARMAKAMPGWLDVTPATLAKANLKVVAMAGWERAMLWPETGLDWVPTSPAIPTVDAAFGYAMTGLGAQLGGFQHGYGTEAPFRLLTFPGQSPAAVATVLGGYALEGVAFVPAAARSLKRDRPPVEGAYLVIEDWTQVEPIRVSLAMMEQTLEWTQSNPYREADGTNRAALFNKHTGSTELWNALVEGRLTAQAAILIEEWRAGATKFREAREPFLLY